MRRGKIAEALREDGPNDYGRCDESHNEKYKFAMNEITGEGREKGHRSNPVWTKLQTPTLA